MSEINYTFLLEISANAHKHPPYYPTTGGETDTMYPTGYDKHGDRVRPEGLVQLGRSDRLLPLVGLPGVPSTTRGRGDTEE